MDLEAFSPENQLTVNNLEDYWMWKVCEVPLTTLYFWLVSEIISCGQKVYNEPKVGRFF